MNEKNLPTKTLLDGTVIYTTRGKKSKNDFIVHARLPSGETLVPKHADFAIDLHRKLCQDSEVAKMVFEKILGVYEGRSAEDVLQDIGEKRKRKLEKSVGYSIEYILHCLELIFKQEDINYPQPIFKGRRMTLELLQDILNGMKPIDAMEKAQLKI